MKYAYQTTFGKKGNCWSACVATLLEVDIENVPNFNEWAKERNTHWAILFEAWLMKEYSFYPLFVNIPIPVYHIASGISPRGLLHSVIYRNNELIFDPHPEGGGITNVKDYCAFVPKDIAQSQDKE